MNLIEVDGVQLTPAGALSSLQDGKTETSLLVDSDEERFILVQKLTRSRF